jgi:hypothetical protein
MLYTVVGKTGSGKSLFQSFLVFEELTRIMNRKKLEAGNVPFYKKPFLEYSYYDWIVLNSDFDDGRGNFVRYCHSDETCLCSIPRSGIHWCYGGHCIGITDLPELYLLSA